jgi:hypothetical protein
MTISLEELFTTYWSQITLIIAFFGYFIKRGFDAVTRKREINHNLFQEKRLSAVNNFYGSYAEVENMWNKISYWDILEKRLNPKEIDALIFPSLNKMSRYVLELHIYFNETEVELFQQVYKNMLAINRALSTEYFEPNVDKGIIQKTNAFLEIKDKMFKENEPVLLKINKMVKLSFK